MSGIPGKRLETNRDENDGYEDEKPIDEHDKTDREIINARRRKRCLSVLLSYGITIYRENLLYLKGRSYSIPPRVPTCTYYFLHAAGLSGLEHWIAFISKVRIKMDMGYYSLQEQHNRSIQRIQEYDQTGHLRELWKYLKSHDKLREICDKDLAMREGTAVLPLMDACRDFIRSRLYKLQEQNLFVVVPKLPLPKPIQSYLLYHETLELDY